MLNVHRSTLLLVDFQLRLAPVITAAQESLNEAERLAQVAQLLDVPVIATEQIPEKLGRTVDQLRVYPNKTVTKLSFDAMGELTLGQTLDEARDTVLVAGWEAHICVLQTAFGLARAGFIPVVVADAIASRNPFNKDIALRRIAAHGIEIMTVEMVIFEWLKSADHPHFPEVLKLIK